jgi:hypothetical protein
MAGRRVVIGVVLALALGGATFWACGGGNSDRDEKVCKQCTIGIDRGCFDECQELCLADDPNCAPRCAAQCDECRRDLVCGACIGGCTGSSTRCAPSNETVQCDDGTYGGSLPAPPA